MRTEPLSAENAGNAEKIPLISVGSASGVPVPAKVANARAGAPKAAAPEGWWSLKGVTGLSAGVLAAIEAAPDMPRHWKEALKAEVTARCVGELNAAKVDAHFFVEKGKCCLHLAAEPFRMLV